MPPISLVSMPVTSATPCAGYTAFSPTRKVTSTQHLRSDGRPEAHNLPSGTIIVNCRKCTLGDHLRGGLRRFLCWNIEVVRALLHERDREPDGADCTRGDRIPRRGGGGRRHQRIPDERALGTGAHTPTDRALVH